MIEVTSTQLGPVSKLAINITTQIPVSTKVVLTLQSSKFHSNNPIKNFNLVFMNKNPQTIIFWMNPNSYLTSATRTLKLNSKSKTKLSPTSPSFKKPSIRIRNLPQPLNQYTK